MSRRTFLMIIVFSLVAVGCGGSSSGTPDSGPVAETEASDNEASETEASDTAASCDGQAITEGEAVSKAGEFARADAGGDIAFDFFSSGDVVADANARDDFWEVTFTKETGAIEIYLTCSGDLASVGTTGDAIR